MDIRGHVENGQIVIDQGGPLPEGAQFRLTIEANGHAPTLTDRLLQWAGGGVDLPVDLALNHNHYRHGQPKR